MAALHPRPAPARPGPRATVAGGLLAALAAVVLLVLVPQVATPASARPLRPAQDPGATTTPGLGTDVTTTVPVSTTATPTTAAAPTTSEAEAPATGAGSKRVADENRKIWAVVGGLVFVALALTLLTIRYWRKTRPVPVDVPAMVPADAATAAALTATPEPATAEGGPATEPVPAVPAVPAVAVEPTTSPAGDAATDAAVPEVDEPAPAAALEGPASPWAPAAGAGAAASAIDPIEETGDETAPVPVVDAPAVEPAAARRAVAGADHAAADEAWEPRGTGEHERVVVAPASRPRRLTPEQRAALFARRSSDQP